MFGFLKKKPLPWAPPEPRCMFAVACAGPLPRLDQLVHPQGKEGALPGTASPPPKGPVSPAFGQGPLEPGDTALVLSPGKARISVIVDASPEMVQGFPGATMPPETWRYVRLDEDLARRSREARCVVMVSLVQRGQNLPQDVLFVTRLAERVALLSDGCVNDLLSCRYFGPGTWRVPNARKDVEAQEHVVLHGESEGSGVWVHTHGLLKFGRPELEIYEVPRDLWEKTALVVLDLAAYLIGGALLRPGDTVGDPEVPLRARLGTQNRDRHWKDCPVLELLDVDGRRQAVASGAVRGIEALLRTRGS
jgi:hypothetical protein